ncbi:MAG TPA: hypothetical protein DCZ06_00665 [Alphaproteobacteria bacterium]|nr:hypothetical protein [Alphaproteobacteria bacterium]
MNTINKDTYYRDHWVEVEQERVDAYQELFKWRPEMDPLLAPADIQEGHIVVDYGCGPGGLSLELARRVGAGGLVHGIDLNAQFIKLAVQYLAEEGFAERTQFHHVSDDRIPLPDQSVDRLICKNVLEYVPDVSATIAEFRRVVKPGGKVHILDSDWGMLVVEPLGHEKLAELFAAAEHAYHTPRIGRILYSEMKKAGYADVAVKILASADTRGRSALVLHNMVNYAKTGGDIDPARADALYAEIRQSIKEGTFMMILPQFLVTGQL